MPVLYVDFENGNDNHGGTSFALLAQGTNGRIASTTFSSIGASFPNDGSLIGQYLSIFNGSIYAVYNITAWVSSSSLTIAAISGGTALANQAVDRQYYIGGRWRNFTTGATAVRTIPGDTIRVMGSPQPTSLGIQGTWTSGINPQSVSIASTTNATPIRVNCATAHGYSTGDTVVLAGHTINTNANGTWEITLVSTTSFTLNNSSGNGNGGASGTVRKRNNALVRLASAVTQNIASTGQGRTAWIASANVTTSLNTSSKKEGYAGDSISIAAAFTTGRAAYYSTGTLDLSGYQQISFWIQQTAGTIGAPGSIDLRLCSDTTGTVPVNIASIPNLAVTGRWMPVTVDLGTSLGSSIQSIALYVNTDNGAQTFLLSNIIACKAISANDSLTLTSLIGKNTSDETFWGIQSINGTRVMLDSDTSLGPESAFVRGYYGSSQTVTTWKREPIRLGPFATSSTVSQTIQESGASESLITYSGGWDRTDMSTQSLETWLDFVNGFGNFVNMNSRSFINISNFALVRSGGFEAGTSSSHNNNIFYIIALNNSSAAGLSGTSASYKNIYTVINACANYGQALLFQSPNHNATVFIRNILSCGGPGIGGCSFNRAIQLKGFNGSGLIANSETLGMSSCPNYVKDITFRDNGGSVSIAPNANEYGNATLVNCLLLDSTEISIPPSSGTYFYSHNHDQVPGNHKIFFSGCTISAAIDQRYTASGISWKIQPTSSSDITPNFPAVFSIAKIACAANALVTIRAWMRRDNAGLTMRLVCKGGQIAGVTNDVTSSVVAVNAWEQETITFTPTETGVVEITAEAFGGTTFSGWVDDLTISQA